MQPLTCEATGCGRGTVRTPQRGQLIESEMQKSRRLAELHENQREKISAVSYSPSLLLLISAVKCPSPKVGL